MKITHLLFAAVVAMPWQIAWASEPTETARPIPTTRPEMKQLLEDMKQRPPRIPLPETTPEERQALGDRADDYEARLRYHYLIEAEGSAFGSRPRAATTTATRDMRRNADDNMSLTYEFKTELFWIVSRTNNCQYCLGHQEQKLAAAGLAEDTIAGLDSDWTSFPEADQAAFAWARKLTWAPHTIQDGDIAALRKHYNDLQIVEMTLSVAGNNSINRWKEGTGVAQSQHGSRFFEGINSALPRETLPIDSFLTPTNSKFQKRPSTVVPIQRDASGQERTLVGVAGSIESVAEVEQRLKSVGERKSRLPLCSVADTQKAFPKIKMSQPPAWMRLLAHFPNESGRRIDSLLDPALGAEDLSALDRARISWVVARQDRAWYALAHARKKLEQLGQTPEQIFALDGDQAALDASERAMLTMARKLATSPITLTDEQVQRVVELAGPRRATQLINFVTSRAYFDRVTEAAGLSTAEDLLTAEGQ